MYQPLQNNSDWTPSRVQKKGKSLSKLGRFSIQPKPNPTSAPPQEIREYSRDSIIGNVSTLSVVHFTVNFV